MKYSITKLHCADKNPTNQPTPKYQLPPETPTQPFLFPFPIQLFPIPFPLPLPIQ